MVRKIFVSIEGNIGSGKSTYLDKLKGCGAGSNYIFVDEPVVKWGEYQDESGKKILELFYENQEKFSFQFQIMALFTRFVSLEEASKKADILAAEKGYDTVFIISERSIKTDKEVFTENLHEDLKISKLEYHIYSDWYAKFSTEIKFSKTIYIKTNPEVCLERIKKRQRDGELCIPLEYLKRCHIKHEKMIESLGIDEGSVLTLNGNLDLSVDFDQEEWVKLTFDHMST